MAKKEGLVCIIAGPRDCEDYEIVKDAIAKSGFKIREVVSGGANGVDSLGEQWAKENKIPVKQFPADWNNLKAKGAIIKENNWGKKYNANAGFARNEEMAEYAEACIAINVGNTPGTADMIKRAKSHNLKLSIYSPTRPDSDYEYDFSKM